MISLSLLTASVAVPTLAVPTDTDACDGGGDGCGAPAACDCGCHSDAFHDPVALSEEMLLPKGDGGANSGGGVTTAM
jgi:hypothetical protein